jgi:hypothetical protein
MHIEHRKEYELVLYNKDGHFLPLNRADRNEHIIWWFHAHDPAFAAEAAGSTSDRSIHGN